MVGQISYESQAWVSLVLFNGRQASIGSSLDDVGVESKDAQFMRSHHTRQELHDGDFVLERVHFV